jgi:hypothetical protein
MKILRLSEKDYRLILEAVETANHWQQELLWSEGSETESDSPAGIRDYHQRTKRLARALKALEKAAEGKENA